MNKIHIDKSDQFEQNSNKIVIVSMQIYMLSDMVPKGRCNLLLTYSTVVFHIKQYARFISIILGLLVRLCIILKYFKTINKRNVIIQLCSMIIQM